MDDICIHVNKRGINKDKRCENKVSRHGYCTSHLRSKCIQKELALKGIDIKETATRELDHTAKIAYDELIVRCSNAGLETPYNDLGPKASRQKTNCPVCNLMLSSKPSLMRHIRVVHLCEKFFMCDKCPYETSSKSNLDKHSCREPGEQKKYLEREIKIRLQEELGGRELTCALGRPDLVTDTEVIEIKTWSEWKKGLGQILIYKVFWPNLIPRLHMFELPETDVSGKVMMAKHITENYGVVWTEEMQTYDCAKTSNTVQSVVPKTEVALDINTIKHKFE